jgi:hypothetical protein
MDRGTTESVPSTELKAERDALPSSSECSRTRDVGNGLDALLGLEAEFQHEGASMAAAAAAGSGFEEGRALGWTSGAQLGAELAFYAGAVAALEKLELPPRGQAAVGALSEATRAVQLHNVGNAQDIDFDEHLMCVRERFRAAVAIAGLHRVRFDAEKPSRAADLSF